jgi:hypothetical protein
LQEHDLPRLAVDGQVSRHGMLDVHQALGRVDQRLVRQREVGNDLVDLVPVGRDLGKALR